MSSNKSLKRERFKAKATERKKKRKLRKLKARDSAFKKSKLLFENISGQVKEQQRGTFDRSAFTSLQPPDNTDVSTKQVGVLDNQKPEVGFSRGAWAPPNE